MTVEKKQLRVELREKLASIDIQARADKSSELSSNAKVLLERLDSEPDITIPKNFVIGGFAPLQTEPDWSVMLEAWNHQMAFPRYIGPGQMEFLKCSWEELETNTDFGVSILVPPQRAKRVTPDVLIIPGLGFDRRGDRLGRGRGYYDRFLEDFKGPLVGVCFSEQLVEEVPREAHDRPVDYIVTDREIIRSRC